nr:MAG TPA: Potyvirus coat protein [Caudoviricetes sp.]
MQHSFDVAFAAKYGVNAAILFNALCFWCDKNAANGKHEHDGLYWTYNSRKAFAQLFPYFSSRQIEYALKPLIDDGLVVTGNFNTSPYDHTLWYAVTNKGYTALQNSDHDFTILQNQETQNVKAIPVNSPVNNPVNQVSKKDAQPAPEKPEKKSRESFDQIIDDYTTNEDLRSALRSFVQMRNAIKKRLTNRALELLLKKLDTLADDTYTKIEIIDQSVMNSWQGIFPLKDDDRDIRGKPKERERKLNYFHG